jgi:hypothetical protein
MLFKDRADGKRLRLPAFNSLMPYLLRGRNASAVYFGRDVDIENAVKYVHRKNAEFGTNRFNLFGLILAAAARAITEKPDLNRFIKGNSVYQRKELTLSFVVKKRMTEEAQETNAKIAFLPTDTIAQAMDRINAEIEFSKGDEPGPDDKLIEVLHGIPFGKSLATKLLRVLDWLNLTPASMIRTDPLYTTAYFANLGSLGLDAPFHHLYEWGTASLFCVIGRTFQKEVKNHDGSVSKRTHIGIKVTADERISEGIYFAHAAALFMRYLQKPELLEVPMTVPATRGQ